MISGDCKIFSVQYKFCLSTFQIPFLADRKKDDYFVGFLVTNIQEKKSLMHGKWAQVIQGFIKNTTKVKKKKEREARKVESGYNSSPTMLPSCIRCLVRNRLCRG